MVIVVGGAWPVLVLSAAVVFRPTCRLLEPSDASTAAPAARSPISERLGRRLTPRRWRLSATRHAQIGLAVPAALAGLLVGPPMAAVAALAAWAVPLRRLRVANRARRQRVIRDLPDVIDLFVLAFAADLNLRLAVETVVGSGHGAIVERFAVALRQADRGQRLHVAIAAAATDLGDAVRPLLRVLVDHAASAAEMRAQLAVVGIDARLERRRAAEISARQVPVRLLVPLVVAVLPAFGLLTVVPIVGGSLQSVSR